MRNSKGVDIDQPTLFLESILRFPQFFFSLFLKNVYFSEQSLVPCASIRERNLLADTAKIVEKNKICKRKDDFCRNLVTDGLLALGYDASVCKSRWEKSSSYPAGNLSL